MAFVPRRNSCPTTRLSTYNELRIKSTRASIDGSDIEFASFRVYWPQSFFTTTSTSHGSGSTLFYDAVTSWEPETVPFPDWDEEEINRLMEEMKNEVTLSQYTTEKLNLWDILRTKVFRNFKLKAESSSLFGGNCFGRKSKKDMGNFDDINMRGGYLKLSGAPADSVEMADHNYTQQADFSTRRSEPTCEAQMQARPWPKLKRSGAIKGRKPRFCLPAANSPP